MAGRTVPGHENRTGRTHRKQHSGAFGLPGCHGFQPALPDTRGEHHVFQQCAWPSLPLAPFCIWGFGSSRKEYPGGWPSFPWPEAFFSRRLTAFGFSLNYTDTIWNPEVFPALLCLTPFFGVCTGFGLRALSGGGVQKKENGLWLAKLSDRQFYLLCASALFLAWVPVLLAAWPGIFSYDCGWQLAAFVDGEVTGHHPILHTALLGVTRMLGHALSGGGQAGNQTGALLYSLVQMTAMSLLYADVCLFLRQRRTPRWLQLGSLLFLGFHPVNSLMALCATKDSLFTAVFAVFIVRLFRMAEDREAFFSSWKKQALFCANVFFLFALRNNGFHTFLLTVPFLLFAFRRFWKRMLLLVGDLSGPLRDLQRPGVRRPWNRAQRPAGNVQRADAVRRPCLEPG